MSSPMIITSENVQKFISSVSTKFNISYDELMGMWNEQQLIEITQEVVESPIEVVNEPVELKPESSGKCSAITKKGTQCTKNVVSNGRCNLHKLEVPVVVEQPIQSEPVKVNYKESDNGKCSSKTKKGTQCTKNVVSNGRCKLHKLEVPEIVVDTTENNVETTTHTNTNQILSNEFIVDNDMNLPVNSEEIVQLEPTNTSDVYSDTISVVSPSVTTTVYTTVSTETTIDDGVCNGVTKKGTKCTKKSVSNGKCKTHQNVKDDVEEEPKQEPPKKLGPLIVHYRLGLIWDQKVTRFVFLKENGKLYVIGRYPTKLNYLTEEDISLVKSLNLEYKNVDFLTLTPQFPDKIEIEGEYQRIADEVGWNDTEFDNTISSIIIESLEKGECDVDAHVDKLLQRYKYTFFMYEANELRKLSHRLVRYHSQYTDLCSYMFLHKHEILNHNEISKNFTNAFVKKVTKILDEHSKYIKSCNLSRYIKCIENMVPTYVPECLEFAPCEMLDKYILSVAVRIPDIQTVVYSEPTTVSTSEHVIEQSIPVIEATTSAVIDDVVTDEVSEVVTDVVIDAPQEEVVLSEPIPSVVSSETVSIEEHPVSNEPESPQTNDNPRRSVRNIVKSTKSFPKKKKQFKDHVEALREITEPVLEDPEVLTQQ